MPTIEDMKNELEYYYGMIRNLRAKKSELEQKILEISPVKSSVKRLIDFTESQIRRRESEEDVNII